MGTYRNNLSPLPLYSSINEQLHRRPYSNGYIYPLLVSQNYLIPFFASFPHDLPSIESIDIYQLCTCGDTRSLTLDRTERGDYNIDFNFDFFNTLQVGDVGVRITTKEVGEEEWFTLYYNGNPDISWGLPRGIYYLVLNLDHGMTLYSEVFTAVPDAELLSQTIEIAWSDNRDLVYENGFIPYSDDYINRIYLNTKIGKPEYSLEEEGKDRDGYFFPEKQISKKTFKFTALVTESLYDSMRLIGMSDSIYIRDTLNREYSPTSFNSEIEWLEDGYLAETQCEFNTDTVIKITGKPIY